MALSLIQTQVKKIRAALCSTLVFVMIFFILSGYYTLQNFVFTAEWVGAYSLVITVLYGIQWSLFSDWLARKVKWSLSVSFALHLIGGALFGLFTHNLSLSALGMLNAAIFFFMDSLFRDRISGKRLLAAGTSSLLVLVVLYSGVSQYENHLVQKAFTPEEAVQFATQSPGTYTFDFPHSRGTKHEVIDGYDVWKATDVREKSAGDYIVTFTERWKKGKVSGQRRTFDEVIRNQDGTSVTGAGSDGDAPPFDE